MRRGILGGTFDPPHVAHLVAAEAAYRQLGLDVVTFIPAGAPWQKADRVVSEARHRWAMTQRAVAGVSYFEADDREVNRRGWTYTIDTLASYPGDEELVLILGADAAHGFGTWHRAAGIVQRAEIGVAPRPGIDRDQVNEALEGARLSWLEGPELAISGTELRDMVRRGLSVRFLVPDLVWSYIEDNGLYGRR